jgi:2,3-bisphosphoglycerate-dependent phosphoglycerate mutase
MLAVATGSDHLTRAMRSLEAAFLIGVEGVTEVWLVRHADSYEAAVTAQDPPLSKLGRDQAKRLAERVQRINPSAVYASPYRRALETAQAITDEVHVDDRLIEVGLEIDQDGILDFKESPDSAVKRMTAVIDEVVQAHEGKRVVVVSHGAAIVALLTDVMRLEPGRLRVLPYYTSISTVRVLGDRRMVGSIGDTAHLE